MRVYSREVEGWQAMSPMGDTLVDFSSGWQFGESGILNELAKRFGVRSCCEIGAGDGDALPVTCDPLIQRWISCQLFEIDERKQWKLREKYGLFPVDVCGEWSLKHQKPCDLLVVDVDSNDLEITLDCLSKFKPIILMVEHRDLRINCHHQATLEAIAAALPDFELLGLTRVNSVYKCKD